MTRPFAELLRDGIDRSGLSLAELRVRLSVRGAHVSVTTLSYWRSGERRPDLRRQWETLIALEEILDLPTGVLVNAADAVTHARHAPPTDVRLDQRLAAALSTDPEDIVDDLRPMLGAPPDDQVLLTSTTRVTDVGAFGSPVRTTTYDVIQCAHGTLDRVSQIHYEHKAFVRLPQLRMLGGGSIITLVLHPSRHAVGYTIEFDRAITPGESVLLALQQDIVTSEPAALRSTAVGVARTARKVANWVRFDKRAVPDWIEEIETTSQNETRMRRRLTTPTSLHQVRWDFGPGVLAAEWGYGTAATDSRADSLPW